MKNISFIIFFLAANVYFVSGQNEIERYGCMFLKSKMNIRPYTDEELRYVQKLEFRSDTFDILNYHIQVDVRDFSSKILKGQCEITFIPKMENLNLINFDLLSMTVDSVKRENAAISFDYKSPALKISFDQSLKIGDTIKVNVYYHGVSVIDPSGFGGFYFENGYAYNLGIGLSSIPHNYGRSWFPCFDNFVERSTYDFDIITQYNHKAYCTGDFLSVDTVNTSLKIFHYRMDQPITTYQAGVAVADYRETNWDFQGIDRKIPIQLVCKPADVEKMKASFAYLPFAIEALESWYGPYPWNRVGYSLTTNGAMEHPTNIAFPDFLGNSGDPETTMDIMAHELAHHWWGDLTTLTTAYDMWIKEGNSEYGWHEFVEYFFGKEKFKEILKQNNFKVLTTAHVKDDGYRALSGMPMDHTYGTTTYNKGAMVMHNLRTYMGDSLFKIGMRSILDKYAFSHLDAAQFEEQLETSTNLNLKCFFDSWIYAPGFNSFEIENVEVQDLNGHYNVRLLLHQKLYHAPDFYCGVPLIISFFDKNNNRIDKEVLVNDEYSQFEFDLPLEPKFWTLNEEQKLNNAQIGNTQYYLKDKSYKLDYELATLKTNNLPVDSVFMRVEHVWSAPDTVKENSDNEKIKVSDQHFWVISGILPENNGMTLTIPYSGSSVEDLDYSLLKKSEDSIFVVYRPDAKTNWKLFSTFTRQKFVPTDKKGSIILSNIKAGQYAFSNISTSITSNNEIFDDLTIFPVPAKNEIRIENINNPDQIGTVEIKDIIGQNIKCGFKKVSNLIVIDCSGLKYGLYFVDIIDKSGNQIFSSKFIKS